MKFAFSVAFAWLMGFVEGCMPDTQLICSHRDRTR